MMPPWAVHGRAFEALRQNEFADEALVVFVQVKLEVQSTFVVGAAAEAVVAVNVLFDFVAGDRLVAGHAIKMNYQRVGRAQVAATDSVAAWDCSDFPNRC